MDSKYIITEKWTLSQVEGLTEWPTSLEIKGKDYELNKKNAFKLMEDYIDQKIVFNGEFKEFIWWWFVRTYKEHPEIYKPKSSYESHTSTASTNYTPVTKTAQTQKAKGIIHIASNSGGMKTLPYDILTGTPETDEKALEKFFSKFSEVFARPCPVTPRHGFVESRVIKTKDEVTTLFQEVRKVDEKGELVVMKPLQAKYNFVITPTSITVGKGHDGATAGTKTRTFPLMGSWVSKFGKPENAGIHSPDVPYLEAVSDGEHAYVVQMRGGPNAPRQRDYVPEKVTVTKIIKASGDLLQWEKKMQEAKGQIGTVVDHSGGSLTTHYGVHAMLNGVPCITSRPVVVGETLEQVTEKVSHNYNMFLHGLMRSLRTVYSASKKAAARRRVTSMIFATQYYSLLDGDNTYYIGNAVGSMLSLGIAACGGEYRHHKNSGEMSGKSRDYIYAELTKDYLKARSEHPKYADSFANDEWGSSYGGAKWYDCADAVIQLEAQVLKFLRKQTDEGFNNIMMAMNRAINCAHNGGWWFNKYISQEVFTGINSESMRYIVDAATYMYDTPPRKMTVAGKKLLKSLKQAEPIVMEFEDTKVPIEIEAAQVRLTQENTKPTGPEQMSADTIRIQTKCPNLTENDYTVKNLADIWDYTAKQSMSWASKLEAYVKLTIEKSGDMWLFKLPNDKVIYKQAVQYKVTRVKKQKEAA